MCQAAFQLTPASLLKVVEGDLTCVATDAIVNAANSRMLGGGGVDGAIHRAAGPQLLAACREVPELAPGVRCPEGQARITPGFRLPSDFVIHTVGPVYVSHEVSAPVLADAYRSCLELANQHQLCSIAFPAVSCGVFGYPLDEAARVAIETCQTHVQQLKEIQFVLFGDESFSCWRAIAAETLIDAAHGRQTP